MIGHANARLHPQKLTTRRFVCRGPTIKETTLGDSPGGPVVKNSLSNAREAASIPGQRSKIPHGLGNEVLRLQLEKPVHCN